MRVVSRSTRPWMRSVQSSVLIARDQERRVDPVELGGRHDDRRQPRDRGRQVRSDGERRDGDRRGRDGRPAADRRDAPAFHERSPEIPSPDGRDADGTGPDEERSPRPVGHPGRRRAASPVVPTVGTGWRGRPGMIEQPAEDPQAEADRDRRGRAGDPRVGQRVVERRDEADDPECCEGTGGDGEPPSGDQTEPRPDQQRDGDDEQLERELVVGAEQRDDDVLRAGWLEVDDGLADRGDERGRAGQQTGQQFRDAERGRRRDDPGDRGAPIAPEARGRTGRGRARWRRGCSRRQHHGSE